MKVVRGLASKLYVACLQIYSPFAYRAVYEEGAEDDDAEKQRTGGAHHLKEVKGDTGIYKMADRPHYN